MRMYISFLSVFLKDRCGSKVVLRWRRRLISIKYFAYFWPAQIRRPLKISYLCERHVRSVLRRLSVRCPERKSRRTSKQPASDRPATGESGNTASRWPSLWQVGNIRHFTFQWILTLLCLKQPLHPHPLVIWSTMPFIELISFVATDFLHEWDMSGEHSPLSLLCASEGCLEYVSRWFYITNCSTKLSSVVQGRQIENSNQVYFITSKFQRSV